MEFFESHGIIPDEWREYLVDVPSEDEIRDVLKKLGMSAEELVRKKEPVFIEKYEGKQLSEEEWISALHQHPQLIQRPIIIMGNKAFFGRSEDDLNQLLT